ncbi:CaM_binding domain-containing protein [Cephalotus follicularis]|uniref:CaM_binding domain-containing protein n=1 Tax=Cephalotus follicularis TaxID=3775 RepID=A0A1Q3C7G0_CEPFO|nr:CaM_binding domain-containing protein [Cephalotus follicularis]
MVQRKVPNKLGIQVDHVKSEKRLGNLKPSSGQHQDGKNRRPHLKKKMKKSRSAMLSDIVSFRSSPLKNISQHGKPPLLIAPSPTPQKQPPTKTPDGLPRNYMKSTSSSKARKESAQVSSQKTRTASDNKNRPQRNSPTLKFSSAASGNKPARALTRSSSLKLVRTWTTTPNFKSVRASMKKCSRVVLCSDMGAQRATCSSTLKDSKFPPYLMINPGGTAAEGPSVMKVCPYTYCSLNGHHHVPLPPLKCFMSTRRHSLKTKKSMKVGHLSPQKAKLIGDGTKEDETSQGVFDDKATYREAALGNSVTVPLIQVGKDFFIAIYAKNNEDDVELTGRSTYQCAERIHDSAEEVDEASIELQSEKQQVVESLSDGSPKSEIDFEDNSQQYIDFMSTGEKIRRDYSEEQRVEDENEDHPPVLANEEMSSGSIPIRSEGVCHASVKEDNMSQSTDKDREEEQLSSLESHSETSYPIKDDYAPAVKNRDLYDEPETRKDCIVSNNNEEILVVQVLQEFYLEERAQFDTSCNESDSEMDGTHQDGEILESSQLFDSFINDQLFSTDYDETLDEFITTIENAEETKTDLTSIMNISGSIEKPIVEPTASEKIQENGVPETEIQLGVAKNNCNSAMAAEDLNDQNEDEFIQHNEAMRLQHHISDAYQNSNEAEQFESSEDYSGKRMHEDSDTYPRYTISDFGLAQVCEAEDVLDNAKVHDNHNCQITQSYQLDDISEDCSSSNDTVDESLLAETQEENSDGQHGRVLFVGTMLVQDKYVTDKFKTQSSSDAEEQSDTGTCKISLAEKSMGEFDTLNVEDRTKTDTGETDLVTKDASSPVTGSSFFNARHKSNQELPKPCDNRKWTIECQRATTEDYEDPRNFNPQEPNYLAIAPDPDADKVDLRHQMMDERKNAEEWMVDYALQQAVTKLAPARKKKVPLLVEAFETVIPLPKFETHLRHTSDAFAHSRTIQACS